MNSWTVSSFQQFFFFFSGWTCLYRLTPEHQYQWNLQSHDTTAGMGELRVPPTCREPDAFSPLKHAATMTHTHLHTHLSQGWNAGRTDSRWFPKWASQIRADDGKCTCSIQHSGKSRVLLQNAAFKILVFMNRYHLNCTYCHQIYRNMQRSMDTCTVIFFICV